MIQRFRSLIRRRVETNKLRKIILPDFALNTDFSSNDYLGIARDNDLCKKISKSYQIFIDSNKGYPVMGSTGSRLLTGTSTEFNETEKCLSRFHMQPYCLLANSGWDLNYGIMSSLPGTDTAVIYDELVHNSVVIGSRSGRQKSSTSFRHNDLNSLQEALLENNSASEKLIVVESVYSMDGDECPLAAVLDLALRENAMVLVDEAHSVGVYGQNGEGLIVSLGLQAHPALLGVVYTFGKAIGQHGAALLTSHPEIIPVLLNYSKPLIYSTSLPVHALISIRETYETLPTLNDERQSLFSLIAQFKEECLHYNIPLLPSNSAIQGVLVPTNEAVMQVAQELRSKYFSCFPIRAPTVPAGAERIRIIIHSFNDSMQVSALCEALSQAVKR
eukprot:gene9690-20144_t